MIGYQISVVLDVGTFANYACGEQMLLAWLLAISLALLYFGAMFAPIIFGWELGQISPHSPSARLARRSVAGLIGVVLLALPIAPALGEFRTELRVDSGFLVEKYCRRIERLERSIDLGQAEVRYAYKGPKNTQLSVRQPGGPTIRIQLYESRYLKNIEAFAPVYYRRHLEMLRDQPFGSFLGEWEPYTTTPVAYPSNTSVDGGR